MKEPPLLGLRLWVARVTLVFLALVVSMLTLECGLRKFGPAFLRNYSLPFALEWQYRYLERHPVYGTFHIPSTTTWMWSAEFITRIEINSHGLRERGLEVKKPPNTRRVVVLGDSFTEAPQVETEASFTRRLEASLNAPGRDAVQVINAGVTGFGTAQAYLLLKHQMLRFQPDLIVLVMYYENDLGENSFRIRNDVRRPHFLLAEDGQLQARPFQFEPRRDRGALDYVLRESLVLGRLELAYSTFRRDAPGVYAALRNLARGSSPASVTAPGGPLVSYVPMLSIYAAAATEEREDAWQITEALLGAVRDEAALERVGVLLVGAPASFEVYPDDWESVRSSYDLPASGWDLDGPSRRVAQIAARRQIPYLDLGPALREAALAGPRLYFPRDRHWTVAGHAAVAQAMAQALADGSLID